MMHLGLNLGLKLLLHSRTGLLLSPVCCVLVLGRISIEDYGHYLTPFFVMCCVTSYCTIGNGGREDDDVFHI